MTWWSFVARSIERAKDAVVDAVVPTPDPCIPAIPILIIDAYWKDLGESNVRKVWPWSRILSLTCRDVYPGQSAGTFPSAGSTHAYHGAVLKATQGTSYYRDARAWFGLQWRALDPVVIGRDFWRGAYHYLEFTQDGSKQADYYLSTVDGYGGFARHDIRPIVDIEFGGPAAKNRTASKQQVIDCANAFSRRVKDRTGRDPILYGGSALSSLRIKDQLGCRGLWPAAYGPRLKAREATSIGWTFDDIIMWQYTNGRDGGVTTSRGTKLPIGVPGVGALDCSVVVVPGGYAGARKALT